MPPTLANGKICYIEIPATDIEKSAAFYKEVFGWKIRKRGDGAIAFDDGVGQVSGTWVLGRAPSATPGLLVYVMVESIEAVVALVTKMAARLCSPLALTHRRSSPGSATPVEL